MEQFGYANESNIENIKNNGTSVASKTTYAEKISFVMTEKNTTPTNFEYSSNSVGGICGKVENTNISVCANGTVVTGSADGFSVAGIVGDARSNKTVKLSSCTNTGTILTQTNDTGGIAGTTYGTVNIENCTNNGIINSTQVNIGGITGFSSGGKYKKL